MQGIIEIFNLQCEVELVKQWRRFLVNSTMSDYQESRVSDVGHMKSLLEIKFIRKYIYISFFFNGWVIIKLIRNTHLTIEVCYHNIWGTWHICFFDTSTKKFNRAGHWNIAGGIWDWDNLFTGSHELLGINSWIRACISENRN